MRSPPPSNILLDPLPELRQALKTNQWGILSSNILEESSYPRTEEERRTVREESRSGGRTSGRVVGRAEVAVEEGGLAIGLDRRGWTVSRSRYFIGIPRGKEIEVGELEKGIGILLGSAPTPRRSDGMIMVSLINPATLRGMNCYRARLSMWPRANSPST
jgi:hypothetical protein